MKINQVLLIFLVLSLLVFSGAGCNETQTETTDTGHETPPATTEQQVLEKPVGFGKVDAHVGNWDSDPENDGYYVWFTLKNSEGESIPANGQIFFTIFKDGSVIRTTNKFDIRAEEFKTQKVRLGPNEIEEFCYLTKFETDKIDHSIYVVGVTFISPDGKQYSAQEQTSYL